METIVVLFSCGAASAVAVRETYRRYGLTHRIRVVNNPVAEEGEDNRRFLRDVERWLDIKVEIVTNPKYPNASAEEVWDRRGAMSFPHGAPCTFHLKKEARQIWEAENPTDYLVLGFGAEERDRHDAFVLTERSNVLPVLIDAGLTRQDCFEIIIEAGIEPPEAYALGYPNANCRGCVKATSPTYWNHVRKVDPEVFERRAEQSRRLGVHLVRVKNERIFLDELDPNAVGRPLKSLKMPECNLFCEEKLPRKSKGRRMTPSNPRTPNMTEAQDINKLEDLLTRWDDRESVGDELAIALAGNNDWRPVRTLIARYRYAQLVQTEIRRAAQRIQQANLHAQPMTAGVEIAVAVDGILTSIQHLGEAFNHD